MKHEYIIIVHDLEQATAALQAANDCKRSVTLRSAPEAAAYLSATVFKAMIDEAATAVPGAKYEAALDCGDKPGLVMNALRHGIKVIRTNLSDELHTKMASIAEQTGATVKPYEKPYDETPVLDLHHVSDPASACRDWLKQT